MANISKTHGLLANLKKLIVSSKANNQLKSYSRNFSYFSEIPNLDLKQKLKTNQNTSNPDSKDKITNHVNTKGDISFFSKDELKIIDQLSVISTPDNLPYKNPEHQLPSPSTKISKYNSLSENNLNFVDNFFEI
jgi:hypothetical protein